MTEITEDDFDYVAIPSINHRILLNQSTPESWSESEQIQFKQQILQALALQKLIKDETYDLITESGNVRVPAGWASVRNSYRIRTLMNVFLMY
jgi:hypothetical protein